jgi:asparagine synthase (glutamine-hydrolysing)
MCGIAGIAGNLPADQLRMNVQAMIDALAHRGPDDEGSWVGEGFAFGMRRLSIIDLAGGHQPIWDARTRTGLVYNGELYNYKTVRAALEESGVTFHTASDTEVVLQSLVTHGTDAIDEWNGMFALAAWDDRHKKLLLVRDRIGVKPLYYYWDGSILLFASEIKALLASPLVARRLNRQSLWDYLTFRYVPGPETIWENIWKLPPGHTLEWRPGQPPRLAEYWHCDVVSTNEPFDIEQKTREFEELFVNAVEQRLLTSDVPVGLTLSGGLDSSAIAAAAVELGYRQFHTFSVGFADGGEYSELPYARAVAKHLGLPNHEVVIDQQQFLDTLPDAVRASDEPLSDLTIVPLLALLRLTRQHVKVALSGEGSDEVLAGYDLHLEHRKYEVIRQLQRLPASVVASFGRAVGVMSQRYGGRLDQIARTPLEEWNVTRRAYMPECLNGEEKARLWPGFEGGDSTALLTSMYAGARSRVPLDQLLSVFQKAWLVEDLLMKADKMSMAVGVEIRVPFLDYRLVEWANSQPIGVKIGRLGRRTVTKRVLRRFATRRLPKVILQRPKRGFPVPVRRWLSEPRFRGWAHEHITGKQSKIRHLFRQEEMESHLHRAASGDDVAADKSWLLLVLETWLRQFDVDVMSEAARQDAPALVQSHKYAGS